MSGPNETNGCGAQDSPIQPPNLIFEGDCNDHDLAYDKGGTELNRMRDDDAFLGNMLDDVGRRPWYYRPFYGAAALTYYAAVRSFGWIGKSFNYTKGDEK
jgi:hypothetical protein